MMLGVRVPDSDKVCRGCNLEVQRELTRCDKCNAPYHPSCIKSRKKCCSSSRSSSPSSGLVITKDELSAMLAEQTKQFSMQINPLLDAIKDVSNRVCNIENTISGTLARVDTLEGEIQGIKKDTVSLSKKIVDSSEHTFLKCLEEMEDRESRKKNIILFNAPENVFGLSTKNDLLHDSNLISEIFKTLSPNVLTVVRYSNRLGVRQQMALRPRPLRVSLDNENSALSLISAFKTLKTNKPFPDIMPANLYISRDSTPLQMQRYRDLRREMGDRMARGEKDLIIIHVRGMPKIIRKSQTPHSSVTDNALAPPAQT